MRVEEFVNYFKYDFPAAEGTTPFSAVIAAANIKPGTISRVIVCTDGDANVGPHSFEQLLSIIDQRARQGVALSTIGFGMGNYKDAAMEQLADKGNGNNYYIDSIDMAKRVFADQLTSTLEVAAKDVKLQVDFDPSVVSRYRLIGYENRAVDDQDFRNDAVGGGQVGWGHQVTALYEVEVHDATRPLATPSRPRPPTCGSRSPSPLLRMSCAMDRMPGPGRSPRSRSSPGRRRPTRIGRSSCR